MKADAAATFLRFRPRAPDVPTGNVGDLLAVGQLIDDAMRPRHFFAAPPSSLAWIAARSETIAWEIFRGRLLAARQTRLQRTFLSWHMVESSELAAEPMVSVKLDVRSKQIHVTRGLLAYAWEGYDAGGGVIESREAVQWTRELVGTIVLNDFSDLETLRDEIICLIWQAVVGTSRLPLTSVEAPLPAFVFGQLHYCYQLGAEASVCESWPDFLAGGVRPAHAWSENVKLVEFALRCAQTTDLPRLAEILAQSRLRASLPKLFRSMFNDVSLSPHTGFVDNALDCVNALVERGAVHLDERTDFLGYLLRQLSRHLTAYDLVTFHHRGANYPDALLLDSALKRYVRDIDQTPERFLGDEAKTRMRRRALRQACLLRRHYEGHLVPDLPTSAGENARVLPASHPRVPEEQLAQPLRRKRELYAGDPLPGLLSETVKEVLAASIRDLEHIEERTEMGLGVFIDRPFGYGKVAAEPDVTPLLAHEAFSASLARRRWRELLKLCGELALNADQQDLQASFDDGPWPMGLPNRELAECPRPTAALADARKVADDFVILRTLPGGLAVLWETILPLLKEYRLPFLAPGGCRLCVQTPGENGPRLVFFDDHLRRRVEMSVDGSNGYCTRAEVEWPRAEPRVLIVWEDTDEPEVLRRRIV